MKIRRLFAAYALTMGVVKYRQSKQRTSADKNEKCENYYRCDDVENDGRGSY
jgi:hypothetical protein